MKKICRDCGWEKLGKFVLWTPTFGKNGTYVEETSPTNSIRIKENNELERKTDELEGKTNDASHYSFKEQASKMPKVFLKQ